MTNGREPAGARAGRSKLVLRATWVLLLAGIAAAGLVGITTYASTSSRAKTSFQENAKSASSGMATALLRDEDFVVSQEGMFEAFPDMTNREYLLILGATDVPSRYPGSLGFSFIERVPAADLKAFLARRAASPSPGVPDPGPGRFVPFPAGPRAQYCLTAAGYKNIDFARDSLIMSYDFCAHLPVVTIPEAIAAATASGSLAVASPFSLYPGMFFLAAPVYKHGVVPASAGARSADVFGWVLGTFKVHQVIAPFVTSPHHLGLNLEYSAVGGRRVEVGSVGLRRGSMAYSASLASGTSGRWYITVVGNAPSGAASSAALVGFLLFGISMLLFAVVRLLAGSRQRALALVDERTREVRHQALHDSLTGLPNRALIVDRANQMLARCARETIDVGVLFIDLDNFKEINDSFGHQRGDQLLKAVAERLSSAVRPRDSVGRLGGDEFVVLVQGTSDEAGPALVAERVLEVLAEPFVLEGMERSPLNIRASIGIAGGPRPSADELLRDADVALYRAKEAGKGRFVLFEPEMQHAVQDRLALEMDLRAAIFGDELFIEYQPIFDLGSLAMTGVEALVRWEHPLRGVVGPDKFIPIAEETGLIHAIGELVLNEAFNRAAAWSCGGRPVPISVNISRRQLISDELVTQVEEALATSGLGAELVTLELAESAIMHDVEEALPRLRALKKLGVRLAIDDFGTGYSSLSSLRRLPVDALKIDRSFISGIARSRESHALIHTLVQLGKTLGLSTLAEGIEDEAQLSELQREQCDHGQGFYYSRALSAEALEPLLFLGEGPEARSAPAKA